jgi:hypothetical protein
MCFLCLCLCLCFCFRFRFCFRSFSFISFCSFIALKILEEYKPEERSFAFIVTSPTDHSRTILQADSDEDIHFSLFPSLFPLLAFSLSLFALFPCFFLLPLLPLFYLYYLFSPLPFSYSSLASPITLLLSPFALLLLFLILHKNAHVAQCNFVSKDSN